MSMVYTYVANKKTDDPLAKLILFSLGAYADWVTGICWPSAKTLAEDCECSERSVRAKIEHLEKLGLIEVVPREGRSPVLRIVGYKEFYLETIARAKGTPANSAAPQKRTPEIYAATPEIYARTPADSADEHSIEHTIEHKKKRETNLVTVDWQQPPKRVSNENPTSVGASGEAARDTARRLAAQAEAKKISINGWPWLRRDENPKEFAAWMAWFEANNCTAQATIARGNGFMRVPTISVKDGEDLFRRKFLVANPAQMSNSSLSANGST